MFLSFSQISARNAIQKLSFENRVFDYKRKFCGSLTSGYIKYVEQSGSIL